MRAFRNAVGAGLCAAVLSAGVAAPAYADEPDLARARQALTARIDGRMATLDALTGAVNSAPRLTVDHRIILTDLLARDGSGLTALKTKVAGESTAAGLKADAEAMVNDHRVYRLRVPQVRLAIAADTAVEAAGVLQKVHDRLALAAAAARRAGRDVSKVEAELAAMQRRISSATATVAGKVDALLTVMPNPDEQMIRGHTTAVRDAAKKARADLRAAAVDAREARALLQTT